MEQKDIFEKWKKYFSNNKSILKQLSKIENLNLVEFGFFNNLNFSNQRIYGKLGIGYNHINELSLNRLIYALIRTMNLNSRTSNHFLISCDGRANTLSLLKGIVKIKVDKIKFITYENFLGFDEKITSMVTKKTKPIASVHIQQSIFNNNIIEIIFLDKDGKRYNNEILEVILDKSIQYSGFEIPISAENKLSFLDTELISNIFSEKIISLYTKHISTAKTKITISNHNLGVSKIFSKLISKLDYAYVINQKPKTKNIPNLSIINDYKIKKIFNNEIKYAKKNNSNVLISFDNTGTRLFIFLIYNNKTYFLNENLISLMFLHEFFNNLQLENKKISNYYLNSNIFLSKPLENICTKYQIPFKLSENSTILTEANKYMLYYWNTYQQFSFGEVKNNAFSIYHICLKILEIINYQNLQHNSIKPLLNSLNKMYGNETETKFYLDYELNFGIEKIEHFIQSNEYNKNFRLIFSDSTNTNKEENLLFAFELNSQTIIIKYNVIFKKFILIWRKNTTFNWISSFISPKTLLKKHLRLSLNN